MNPTLYARLHRQFAQDPCEPARQILKRAQVQIEFARSFLALVPEKHGTAVDLAESRFANLSATASLEDLRSASARAEEDMADLGQLAKRFTVHCVGHGHIDMNWMWSWPETVAATHDTFASVLSLMSQYPELTYSQSQASVYALMEKYHPDLFAQIQQRVAEGRWEVTAAHWVEGDKNLASGESLVRHLLYSRKFMQEKFGLTPEDVPVDWEPDTFGHANTIPSILAKAGVRFYYCCRPGGGDDHWRIGGERPPLFWWQAPDGSRVLVNKETTWYNSYVNIGDNVALPMLDFCRQTGLHDWLNCFGLGNHGGGPTRDEIRWLLAANEFPIYPDVKFSRAKDWFEKVAAELPADLPVLDHELNFEFTGCYTSQSAIKKANRLGESYCVEAETLALLDAALGGADVPEDRLREAWIHVLFNQFHDILPGSGVAETRAHALGGFQETAAITGAIKRSFATLVAGRVNSFSLLPSTPEAEQEKANADQVNTPFVAGAGIGAGLSGYSASTGGGKRFRPFVVWNPCAWDRFELVRFDVYDPDVIPELVVAREAQGGQWPTMFLGKSADWGHEKYSFLVPVSVPALGYATVMLCEGLADQQVPTVRALREDRIETPDLELHFDRYSGGKLWSAENRRSGTTTNWLGEWLFQNENPRGMTAWILGSTHDPVPLVAEGFHMYGVSRNQGTALPSGASLAYLVRQVLRVPGTQSRVRLEALVHGLSPVVEWQAEIDWREIGTPERGIPGLTVGFGLCAEYETRSETPFGSVERPDGWRRETPSQRYVHVRPSRVPNPESAMAGLTLVQDCKYGFEKSKMLQMRVVRSSFDPDHAPEVAKSTLRYATYLHDTSPTIAELTRLGAAWNHPLIPMPATLQSGDLSPVRSFVRVDGDAVLTSLKPGADGGSVLRLVEYDGKDAEVRLELDPALFGTASNAEVVDLLERPTGETVPIEAGSLRVSVPKNGTFTLRVL